MRMEDGRKGGERGCICAWDGDLQDEIAPVYFVKDGEVLKGLLSLFRNIFLRNRTSPGDISAV